VEPVKENDPVWRKGRVESGVAIPPLSGATMKSSAFRLPAKPCRLTRFLDR